jgi:hypothetical protein
MNIILLLINDLSIKKLLKEGLFSQIFIYYLNS